MPFNKDDVHAVKGGKVGKSWDDHCRLRQDLDQRWADYAVDFMKKQNGASKPFFLYYGTRGCHFDNYPNAYYAGRSPRNDYTDCIVEMNDIFAQLYETLDETGESKTRSSSSRRTTGPSRRLTRMGARRFAAAKARHGKAASGFRLSSIGRA